MDSGRESILKVGRELRAKERPGQKGSSRLFVVGWIGEREEKRWTRRGQYTLLQMRVTEVQRCLRGPGSCFFFFF